MCRRPPPNHLLPSTPLPAGGYNEAREEARPGTPAPITAAALSRGLLQKRVAWPPPPPSPYLPQPLALAQLATLFLTPPAPVVAPAGSALRGRLLGSLPPLSFLKFKIHLSQEEGKLLPLKPLALSSKSSLLRRRRLLAPAGPGVTSEVGGGGQAACVSPLSALAPCSPAAFRAGRERGAVHAPPKAWPAWGQGAFEAPPPPALLSWQEHHCCSLAARLPLVCCTLTACLPLAHHLLAISLLTLIWSRKGVLLVASMPWCPPRCGTAWVPAHPPTPPAAMHPAGFEAELDALPARCCFYLISLLQSWQYLNINACL